MIRLQRIIFPHSSDDSARLYYRSDQPVAVSGIRGMDIPRVRMAFDTYYNMFSLQTWKRHTHIGNVFLEVSFRGACVIRLYALFADNSQEMLGEYAYDEKDIQTASIIFPETEAQALFWSLEPSSGFSFREGWYATDAPDAAVRDTSLAVVFCTFKRERYIRENVAKFAELAAIYPETAGSFSLHIVDNGRTLERDAFTEAGAIVYPNPNVGGSGGFARGILEVLEVGEATHVLLMDDDVSFLSESFFRTFTFLRLCKEEYHRHFIGGAMLDLLRPGEQYESVAVFSKKRLWENPRHGVDLTERKACLANNTPFQAEGKRPYQGWWYCAIPVRNIREHGLPYPFFVRQDDIEFAIRQGAAIVHLNGICVWHEPFYKKDNNFTWYLMLRNLLVFSALYPDAAGESAVLGKIWIREFLQAAFTGNYAKAKTLAAAVEDFLRGPEFLQNPATGEAVLRTQAENKGEIRPLSEFSDLPVPRDLTTLTQAKPCGLLEKTFCLLTLNGLLLPPFLRKKTGFALLGKKFQLRNYLFRKAVLVINPHEETAELRVISARAFAEALLRSVKMGCRYLWERRSARERYRNRFNYMTSRNFWEEHLGLSGREKQAAVDHDV